MLPDLIVYGSHKVCNQGEELLCRSSGGALIAVVFSSRILASKNDRKPVAGRDVVGAGSAI
jgi:hypothetical protein